MKTNTTSSKRIEQYERFIVAFDEFIRALRASKEANNAAAGIMAMADPPKELIERVHNANARFARARDELQAIRVAIGDVPIHGKPTNGTAEALGRLGLTRGRMGGPVPIPGQGRRT